MRRVGLTLLIVGGLPWLALGAAVILATLHAPFGFVPKAAVPLLVMSGPIALILALIGALLFAATLVRRR